MAIFRGGGGKLYVAVGALLGAAYVAFDVWAERRLARGTLTGALAGVHDLVDHLLPLVLGAVLGLCLYQLRLRERLARAEKDAARAEEEAARAEALRVRLTRLERDQAVWILAASLLHEMNNPLHALGLLLDEQAACADDPERRAELSTRARAQMNRILSSLSALRTLRAAGEPDVEELALDRLVRSVAEEVAALAASRKVEVVVEADGPLAGAGDAAYVRTILENLLDNSLHALGSEQGGRVSLSLHEESGRAVIRVEDDGPELTQEVRAALFDPLRSTKSQGLGLGLPISRALARAMRGELALDPRTRKAFRLELPTKVSA